MGACEFADGGDDELACLNIDGYLQCAPARKRDEICGQDWIYFECEKGLTCPSAGGRCRVAPGIGEFCSTASGTGSANVCGMQGFCDTETGRCREYITSTVPREDPCFADHNYGYRECSASQRCEYVAISYPEDVYGLCKPRLAVFTDGCGYHSFNCEDGSSCRSGRCLPFALEGDLCGRDFDCAGNMRCDTQSSRCERRSNHIPVPGGSSPTPPPTPSPPPPTPNPTPSTSRPTPSPTPSPTPPPSPPPSPRPTTRPPTPRPTSLPTPPPTPPPSPSPTPRPTQSSTPRPTPLPTPPPTSPPSPPPTPRPTESSTPPPTPLPTPPPTPPPFSPPTPLPTQSSTPLPTPLPTPFPTVVSPSPIQVSPPPPTSLPSPPPTIVSPPLTWSPVPPTPSPTQSSTPLTTPPPTTEPSSLQPSTPFPMSLNNTLIPTDITIAPVSPPPSVSSSTAPGTTEPATNGPTVDTNDRISWDNYCLSDNKKSIHQCLPKIGSELGWGYDIVSGTKTRRAIELDVHPTANANIFADLTPSVFEIPSNVECFVIPESKITSSSRSTFRSSIEYKKELAFRLGVFGQFRSVFFSQSSSFRKTSEKTFEKNQILVESQLSVPLFQCRIRTTPALLTSEADTILLQGGVNMLPKLGTHVITTAKFGGELVVEMQADSCVIRTQSESDFGAKIRAGFLNVATGQASASVKIETKCGQAYSVTSFDSVVKGGDQRELDSSGRQDSIDRWCQSIRTSDDQFDAIGFTLEPLTSVVNSVSINQTDDYLSSCQHEGNIEVENSACAECDVEDGFSGERQSGRPVLFSLIVAGGMLLLLFQ